MQKVLIINEKEIQCACNALTPYLYTQIFGKDFLAQITGFRSFANKKMDELSEEEIAAITKRSQVFGEICFVFMKQAEIKEASQLMKLNVNDYYSWLTELEPGTFMKPDLMKEILELWNGNTVTTTEGKN